MTDDGRVFPVKAVLAADVRNDVAVLKIEVNNLPPLPFAASASVGSRVYCLSHPELNSPGDENEFFAFTRGMVCGKFRLRLGRDTPVKLLAITADYGRGSSGGPILNEHGAVVSMVCSTMALLDDDEGSAQMTWKFTLPSNSILALLQGDKRATAQRPQGPMPPDPFIRRRADGRTWPPPPSLLDRPHGESSLVLAKSSSRYMRKDEYRLNIRLCEYAGGRLGLHTQKRPA